MKLANPVENRDKERLYIGGGTFSSNPSNNDCRIRHLDYIGKNRKTFYDKINKLGDIIEMV